jgi:uncharacterized protein (DUF305 family)
LKKNKRRRARNKPGRHDVNEIPSWRGALRLTLSLVLGSVVGLAASQMAPHARTGTVRRDISWAELTGGMQRMHVAMMSVEPSGNPDVDFVRLMLPHHRGAVDMAKAEVLHGTDPQMRRLAQEIVTDQESEVQLMELWLQRRTDKK